MIPVLMITYNRLDYTKQALEALFNANNREIFIIDNGSTDGTVQWLKSQPWGIRMFLNKENIGIAGAMNQFLSLTKKAEIVGKVDNDTIIPVDFFTRMIKHMEKADIVQAKHPILRQTHKIGFNQWVKTMPAEGPLRYNHFVGGSGILFRRSIVEQIPETDWALGGWRQWQREHPEFKKAFATDIEIKLLDTTEDGPDYSKYPDYYIETKRL